MTEYYLARTSQDYKACHDLVQEEGLEEHQLSFPTIMAIKDGELTGFLSTNISKKQIVAGPLVIKSGARRYWTLIRLIERYENVMRHTGITEFIFSVDAKMSEAWLDKVYELFHFTPYTEHNGRLWFVRKL